MMVKCRLVCEAAKRVRVAVREPPPQKDDLVRKAAKAAVDWIAKGV
jgi:hypothetical protein